MYVYFFSFSHMRVSNVMYVAKEWGKFMRERGKGENYFFLAKINTDCIDTFTHFMHIWMKRLFLIHMVCTYFSICLELKFNFHSTDFEYLLFFSPRSANKRKKLRSRQREMRQVHVEGFIKAFDIRLESCFLPRSDLWPSSFLEGCSIEWVKKVFRRL